jgi:hypothetical protein
MRSDQVDAETETLQVDEVKTVAENGKGQLTPLIKLSLFRDF